MAEHTKGPWQLSQDGRTIFSQKEDGSGDLIATVSTSQEFFSGPNQEEKRANARLITAVPELLEACELLLAAHDQCYRSDEGAKLARAAIAKASLP